MTTKIFLGNCAELMNNIDSESVDLTITSPPYDKLRKYSGFVFDFETIASQLYRVTKQGGVVVWIVGDATVKGSETGTSFKQALYFKEIGFNLFDTMIWDKCGMLPTQDRYYNVFDYQFVLSKGKPKTKNFICDHKTTQGGRTQRKDLVINKGKNIKGEGIFVRNEFSRRTNIWRVPVGGRGNKTGHPAVFPESLARDHVISWSNEGDVVLDPMMGSGTTGKAATENKRNFIGMEISEEYFETAKKRLGV